ncbi:SURP and G-patch domain-containing protein 1 [Holothuria leucospilota]|uniref:SURP and G-patch domain-containing protein 1 n=1 Tax=Holothuria leucospilota TaxID=206669 RepID=A0A9Q1BH09_HOLLE|nr:SURP and G-patch domain-containing protein 1 [Holothuria leucospilota]
MANPYSGGYAQKMAQLSEQEKMIQQKKLEIEKKMAAKRRAAAEEKKKTPVNPVKFNVKPVMKSKFQTSQGSGSTPNSVSSGPSVTKPQTDQASATKSSTQNTFKNDGSFMEQFLKQQRAQATAESSQPMQKVTTSPQIPQSAVSNPRPPLQSVRPKERFKPSDVFGDSSSDEETYVADGGAILPPEDTTLRDTIDRLAKVVAENGKTVEEAAKKTHKDNPNYRFLFDKRSPGYQYYSTKIAVFKLAMFKPSVAGPTASLNAAATTSRSGANDTRNRKRRWEDEGPSSSSPHMPAVGSVNPVGMIGTTELSADQMRQLKEQQEMQLLYNMIVKSQKQEGNDITQGGKIPKHKYEYDSDEDTEGGTWEHKLRKKEMAETVEKAEALTKMGKGKHFIGDFLPPEELEKFMETLQALREGRTPDYSDYKQFKLQADNIGYQMLQKLGWSEGEGLGAENQGITAPVSRGTRNVEGTGLGIDRPAELTKEDAEDEYQSYRKRMMLAYRFRPNPLVSIICGFLVRVLTPRL